MKNFLQTILIAALLMNAGDTSAQVYNYTKNITLTASNFPGSCSGCIINISKGVTVTLNMDVSLENAIVNGGTIEVINGRTLKIWSNAFFSGVTVNVRNASSFVSTNTLSISNSTFKFYNTAKGIFNNDVQMTSSSLLFTDDASMEATKGNFNLINTSQITAGDGTTTSKAYIKFNGALLNIYDNSSLTVANYNNYYSSWDNYNAASKHKSIKTTDNKLNCGTQGRNACSSALLYGPSTLNGTGYASYLMLPVKLSAMTVKLVNNKVEVSWTTDQEMNSSRFEIERSIDGINWTLAGTVAAKGTSSIASNYVFTDNSKTGGTLSYRLKMIDLDETSEYSPIRSLKLAAASHEMSIYPNPATNYVVINAKDASKVQVQLVSYNGQVVKQVSGSGNITMSVTEFNAGSYFVRVADAAGAAQTFKLMIVK